VTSGSSHLCPGLSFKVVPDEKQEVDLAVFLIWDTLDSWEVSNDFRWQCYGVCIQHGRSGRFYAEVLGLKLTNRSGNHWATVEAGRSLTIGLHPVSPRHPAPGTKGGIMIGLEINEPIRDAIERLQGKGVRFSGAVATEAGGSFVDFEDPDGNPFYLWEMNLSAVTESEEMHAPRK
jgi:predicted enzyme related to lactoylglutathione lyase